jgi:mono/diheme cytochrome c family protein
MKLNRTCASLTLATVMFCAAAAAQSGEALYKSKCQSCHGANGTPNPGLAKLLGVKPISDQMAAAVKNGKGKMKPIAGLTDAQIKDVVAYYRGLK